MDYQAANDLLKDRVILVTGAGDGIGRQAALTYASHGAVVILLGKTVSKLEQTYDLIVAANGPEPAIVPLDMQGATEQHYIDMASTIEEQFGRLDGVLLNAGMLGVLSPFEQIDLASWETVMKVNVTAQMMMTKPLLPLLRKADDAALIFTSSGVGKKGRAYWGSYAVSKFATEGMMQILADELSNTNVRVNAINPGATRTSMRSTAYPGEDASKLKTPAEIMPTYLYLMGPDSQDIRGQSVDAQPK
ncbi:YciK family oxidoreductase [Corallincola holothuriorum]|uniref:YciK family oxidoreductase n=1 Tax=Corallincola holothuriorum TaxID=2282215 RepID=A0A368NL36_9GAMM|nr:YciK family oxidoreductase [Corallincola holothuriorum]